NGLGVVAQGLPLSVSEAFVHGFKIHHRRTQMFHDFGCQNFRFGEVFEVRHGRVTKPEHIKACLVPGKKVFAVEGTPTPVRGIFAPRLFPVVPVIRVVAVDEILKVGVGQGLFFRV
ncbi:MAG: hypothetical protein ACX93P_14105, partial [Roseovarius sp.]